MYFRIKPNNEKSVGIHLELKVLETKYPKKRKKVKTETKKKMKKEKNSFQGMGI